LPLTISAPTCLLLQYEFNRSDELEKYLDKQNLLARFVNYASENSVKPDPEELNISGNFIHIQLKGYIARNILDNKGSYPIWEKIDTTLKYAIDYLKKQEI